MKLTRGYISPYFIRDQKTQKCELENPFILIHDKKISDMNTLLKVLELSVTNKRPLLVVAEDVDSDALAMLILNKHHVGLKVCAIKAPGFEDNRRAALDDLVILIGGEVITEERGIALNKVRPEMLGTAKKACGLNHYNCDGVALLYASKVLENLETKNEDERRGVQIIQYHSRFAPTFTIAANAGFDGSLIYNKLLEQDNLNLGFDAVKGTYVDMVKAGIIDPVKVVRTALVDAASVSLLLTTTEASIVENMSDKNKPPQRVADMDDLDY
ncbi:chaperonin CPN60-like 2, mitochondrial [Lathyrus oleraceus]|uniref:chaperonin CPN60-like 2, mitochondrial n=1 Tax=Pisum sativum TaxID=3888 RepID=UPI0021D3B1F7|nr:chaperonin CPN60-like 2, mitochondrial [Pisum sativum]